jgi:hypothetical protein
MTLKSLSFGVIFLSALVTHASPQQSVIKIDEAPISTTQTSLQNRAAKTFLLSAEPIGFAVTPLPTYGANIGLYLSSNAILQVEYASGSIGLGFYDLGAKSLGINVKFFTGNSFYLKTGFDYRRISISGVKCLFCSDPYFKLDGGSADSIALAVGLGNQWQWNTFTMGCDWLGVTAPVITQYSNDFHQSRISAQDQARIDGAFDRVAKAVSLQLLRIYLGASF